MPSLVPGVEGKAAPQCAIVIVWATSDLAEVRALLRDFASDAAAMVLWHPDAGGPVLELLSALAESPFRAQPLTDRDMLEAGVVYVAGGRCRVRFEGHAVRVESLAGCAAHPIDEFLTSLAESWGPRCVAVTSQLPSTDGEKGLSAVRAVGGLGLSRAALESAARTPEAPPLSAAIEKPVPRAKALPSGVSLESRAWRLFALPSSLHAARVAVQRALREACPRGRLRVWVPGCKNGNLAYTMSMLLSEAVAPLELPVRLQLFGTDPDEEALAIARMGRYPARAALDMDPTWRARYTFDEGETIRVSEALRELCVFSSHTLGRDPPLSRMDLVVCQRSFEGSTPEHASAMVNALHFSLRDNGLLLAFDHAESFPEDRFERSPEGYLRARRCQTRRISPAPAPVRGKPVSLLTLRDISQPGAPANVLRAEPGAPRSDLDAFVRAMALPLVACDEELRVVAMSGEACDAFGLSEADRGSDLRQLSERLPGGEDIAPTAKLAFSTGATQELRVRAGHRVYLLRISRLRGVARAGVTLAFTDVSDLDAAQYRAMAQQHQQAAVARVGDLALNSSNEAELFEEALGVLFGNISACVSGVILEKSGQNELAVLASRGLGSDPLRMLQEMGEPADLLDAVLQRESPVLQSNLLTASPSPVLPVVKGGIACPILNEGNLLGIIALYARQDGLEAPEHQHFVQAVANVLGGAIVRHRTRRRLSLELDASSVLASAVDAAAAGSGLERALAVAMDATRVELWVPSRAPEVNWLRLFPEAPESVDAPPGLQPFLEDDGLEAPIPSYRVSSGDELREIVVPVRRRDQLLALLRLQGERLRSPDRELGDGLRRISFMLGDFLDRLQVHDALKRSEASYRRTSAEFEALYASLPVGVSIHDLDGSVRRMNNHLRRLAAQTGGRANGVGQLYSEEAPPWISRVLASGEAIRDIELTTTSSGEVQSWLCNFAPIRDIDGTVLGASAVVQDITAMKLVEASLREADRQKDDFLAILGHELRNPMAAIRNATELLSRMDPSNPQLRRLQNIFDRQTLQTTKLIDGLLAIARVARGKVELQISPVNVADLVRQVVDDRHHQFGARAVDVRLPAGDLWVAADRVRLVQILDNLLSNALKFTSPSGTIVVELQGGRERGHVRVSDDGAGIEAELLPLIFEPFRQGRGSTLQSREGLGLGLALVKGLVDLHGFSLQADSPGAGRGACFVIGFPLTSEPDEAAPESLISARPLSLLLIEDNIDIADTLAELLTDAGHQIQVAGSAEDALVALQSRLPDVILCDIGLPGMDGFSFAARLRDDPVFSAVKLIAMTGYGDASTRARIEVAGFDRYLIKPVKLDALQDCLMRLAAEPPLQLNRR